MRALAPPPHWPKPIILNLGCGTRTSKYCVNIDWSPYVRLRHARIGRAVAPVVLRGTRLERFRSMDGRVLAHDLRRGIPLDDASADAVYHAHLLEHLDRHVVPRFFAEVRRVLVDGGVHRVVVPDLEELCRRYLLHLDACGAGSADPADHDKRVAELIEQLVRTEASGTSRQRPLRRFLENRVLGDARRRGETHRWMYDRANLGALLEEAGFRDVCVVDHRTSAIVNWTAIDLDADSNHESKPASLYLEARK